MDKTSSALRSSKAIRALSERAPHERVTLGGARGSSRSLIAATLSAERPVMMFVADVPEADGVEDDLRHLAPDVQVILLHPSADDDLSDPEARVDFSERMTQLRALSTFERGAILVAPAAVLLEALPSREQVQERTVDFSVGAVCDLEQLRKITGEAGFITVPMVSAPGEMSIRGDIVDLFPLGGSEPIRIELFDDQIESIRTFDLETQLSTRTEMTVSIPLVRPSDIRGAALTRTFLHQHLPSEAFLLFSDPQRLTHRIEEVAEARGIDRGAVRLARSFLQSSHGIDLVNDVTEGSANYALQTGGVDHFSGGVEQVEASLNELRRTCDEIHLFAETDSELKRMGNLLREKNLFDENLHLAKGRLRAGFRLLDARTAWLNHLELLGKPRIYRPRPKRPAIPSRTVNNLLELSEGDYVVHLTHGVAQYQGMTRIKRESGEEDFLLLQFDGDTLFYLAASKIELVQRYVGADGSPPRLDKIGGRSWAKKKARVQAELEALAGELLELQAARVTRDGPAHTRDDALIEEFESSFPYTPTPDQATASRDIHDDLDRERPMDRLICGDVGFGKTELAVRAAFRVVLGGRQVAVLVPTTLLAEQHLRTFQSRFANFPIRIEALSRFRSRKEQNATVAGMKDGSVDIVIGTHRLVSKDIDFNELGLVIIDEEQRFGVKAKEALKKLRTNVDVLTLTATPIPRTLHMALIGMRDISSLNTPPVGRRPVRTEVHKFGKEIIRRAITHELNRDGQVFFVHNRVQSLPVIAQKVAEQVPLAKIGFAHGQMSEALLDKTIRAFQDGELDVLVCTNIVESGLDLPRANTILIDRPEWYGLADLHQLRGRVGRGSLQAYCHLLTPDKPLPAIAEKRVRAVAELSHLGAGYDLSIKDLEIRGAGNLLSGEQHGHIAAVGYDLFVQLLNRAVARAKGERPPGEPRETDVDLSVEAFLPAEYIPDPGQRMELLRRLGSPEGPDVEALEAEMRDRFGRIPPPAQRLLTIFALKRSCRRLGIRRLLYPGGAQVIIEVSNLRAFRRNQTFNQRETVEMSERMVHLHLPRGVETPDAVLELLRDRMIDRLETAAR